MTTTSHATDRRTPVTPERLAERLRDAVNSGGGCPHPVAVPMTALTSGVTLLGAGGVLRDETLARFADGAGRYDGPDLARLYWKSYVAAAPFLAGHLGPLVGWLDDAGESDLAAFRRCLRVVSSIDLDTSATQPPVDGELLGPVYSLLRAPGDKKRSGAFFTPMGLGAVVASIAGPDEGSSIAEPSCGAGGMAVAAARSMRAQGLNPRTCSWLLNDIDPMAVALAGVNAVVHGLGQNVTLRCGDGLAVGAIS